MFRKLFPRSIVNNDRVGFGYFYDRYYTNSKSPGLKVFLFYASVIIFNYYPCKFLYRYIYEHPYWERRQVEKDKQKEIRQAILMSSSRDRREDLRDFYKEYYLTQLLISNNQQHESASGGDDNNNTSDDINRGRNDDTTGIIDNSSKNDHQLTKIMKTWNIIGDNESSSNLISRIIRTNEVLQLFPNRK